MKRFLYIINFLMVLNLVACQQELIEPNLSPTEYKLKPKEFYKGTVEITLLLADGTITTTKAVSLFTHIEIMKNKATDKSGYLYFRNSSECPINTLNTQVILADRVYSFKIIDKELLTCK